MFFDTQHTHSHTHTQAHLFTHTPFAALGLQVKMFEFIFFFYYVYRALSKGLKQNFWRLDVKINVDILAVAPAHYLGPLMSCCQC